MPISEELGYADLVNDKTFEAFEVYLQSLDKLPAEEKARILEEIIRDERTRVKREQAEKKKHEVAKAVIGISSCVLGFFSLAFFWNLPSDQTTVVVNVTDEKILNALALVVSVGWIWFHKPND